MADTSGLTLDLLAVTDARGFLDAFLEALGGEISATDVYEIEELSSDDVADGIYLELVDSEGGHEGGGEYVHRIWAVRKGANTLSHLRVTGYYQSYAGTEYNEDWTLVVPREVVVTQYFAVDGSDDR
jgi:hypothetical protein